LKIEAQMFRIGSTEIAQMITGKKKAYMKCLRDNTPQYVMGYAQKRLHKLNRQFED
jgi:hypothetical protein